MKMCWKRHVTMLTLGTAECNRLCGFDLYSGSPSKIGHSWCGPLANMTGYLYKRGKCGPRDRKTHRENSVKEYSCVDSMVSKSPRIAGCGQRILLQVWSGAKLFLHLDFGLSLQNFRTVCFYHCQPPSLWSSPRELTQSPWTIFAHQACLTCDPWHTCASGQLRTPQSHKLTPNIMWLFLFPF